MEEIDITINKNTIDSPGSSDNILKRLKEDYILHLADTTLILSQRNAEWCGHGPILEQDIALTNISLDLLGQARNFYQYAAVLKGGSATEDTLAYLRTEREFKNLLLVEQPNGDWGQTILRQFFFSVYQYLVYTQLQKSADIQMAAIAEKSIKEVTYHLKWSSEWVIRLGDGTEESNKRMKQALENLWMYTGELFMPADYETLETAGFEIALLKEKWFAKVSEIFAEATLILPANGYMQTGGKTGIHTEHLGYILVELQYLQRTYPGAEW
ncbi:MAG: 1,2-phenylacetyl-CoA epoxidase subunit PaaC [Ferruginibacter sp.]